MALSIHTHPLSSLAPPQPSYVPSSTPLLFSYLFFFCPGVELRLVALARVWGCLLEYGKFSRGYTTEENDTPLANTDPSPCNYGMLMGLLLCRYPQLLCVHEYNGHAITRRQHFPAFLFIFQFLPSFHLFFYSVPGALDGVM